MQYTQGPRNHQVLSLGIANALGCPFPALAQVGRPAGQYHGHLWPRECGTHPSSSRRLAQCRAVRPKAPVRRPAVIIRTPARTMRWMVVNWASIHDNRSGWVKIGT